MQKPDVKLLELLKEFYFKEPFSLGLHTTDENCAKAICQTGLKTGVRALEGTIKFRGDLKQVSAKDLDFFFPYTDHTVALAIPKKFDAPRISDNEGGYKPLCEFSRFFEKAQELLQNYQQDVEGLLPNYYVLGYYNKEYEFILNPKCLLFDSKSKMQFERDCLEVENNIAIF